MHTAYHFLFFFPTTTAWYIWVPAIRHVLSHVDLDQRMPTWPFGHLQNFAQIIGRKIVHVQEHSAKIYAIVQIIIYSRFGANLKGHLKSWDTKTPKNLSGDFTSFKASYSLVFLSLSNNSELCTSVPNLKKWGKRWFRLSLWLGIAMALLLLEVSFIPHCPCAKIFPCSWLLVDFLGAWLTGESTTHYHISAFPIWSHWSLAANAPHADVMSEGGEYV